MSERRKAEDHHGDKESSKMEKIGRGREIKGQNWPLDNHRDIIVPLIDKSQMRSPQSQHETYRPYLLQQVIMFIAQTMQVICYLSLVQITKISDIFTIYTKIIHSINASELKQPRALRIQDFFCLVN